MNTNPAWMHWSQLMTDRLSGAAPLSVPETFAPTVPERLPVIAGPVPPIPFLPVLSAAPEESRIQANPVLEAAAVAARGRDAASKPPLADSQVSLREVIARPPPPETIPTERLPSPAVGPSAEPILPDPRVAPSAAVPPASITQPAVSPPVALPLTPPPSPDGGPAIVRHAALELEGYLRSPGARFGVKNAPSEAVIKFQSVAGLKPDGILGPDVRAAARAVGVTLPPRGSVEPAKRGSSATVAMPITSGSNATVQSRNAAAQQVAATQAALGVVPTGVVDESTATAAATLGVSLPTQPPIIEHNPFGVHTCAAELPAKFGPVRDALGSFASARPTYTFPAHQASCMNGLNDVLTTYGRGNWSTARKGADGRWAALGPLNLTQPTAEWLYQSRAILKPFDAQLKAIKGEAGTDQYLTSMRNSVTDPKSGSWWYVLILSRVEDLLRPLIDLPGFRESGLLTVRADAPSAHANTAQNLAAGVNAIIKNNPSADPVSVLMRLFLRASSLKGMADLAVRSNGVIP